MGRIKLIGKYLDQPMLLNRFEKAVPAALLLGGSFCSINHVAKSPKEERKNEAIKSFCVMSTTMVSALLAPKIASKFFKKMEDAPINTHELIDEFVRKNKNLNEAAIILNKAKDKILKYSEIEVLFNSIGKHEDGKNLLGKLIPDPENIDSKHIFSEIGRLSVLGLIPVLGGIAGGVTGDRLTEKNWKDKIPDKVKEGCYQYLANIFLCNIGAAGALAILEKKNIQSKPARALGMIGGILLTGLIGGSAIANFIGNRIINPIFDKNHKNVSKSLFAERTPEAIDIGLHADDIATVAVMSGLKWIEPALPILYSVSGYRAGIGYRNGE